MQLERKAKTYGAIGTILFLIALLLLLWFSVFSFRIPTEEQGLSMQLGVDAEGGNDFFAAAPSNYANDLPDYPSQPATGEEEFQTQDIEESITMPEKKEKTLEELLREQELIQKEQERQEEARKIAEAKALKDAQDKKAAEIGNRTKDLFGGSGAGESTSSSGQGTGQGTGNQGNPFGTPDGSGNREGTGSGTGGNSYSLSGRSLSGKLVEPSYNVYEEGRIVVTIIVNKDGTVITATVGAGTNIDNPTLRHAALDAAKKTKFNKITTDKNQSGTITYTFKLQ